MAEEVFTTPGAGQSVATVVDEPLTGRSRPRISWGAIFGGAFSALGLWLLLYAFGLAIGLSSVDPNNAHSLKGSGMFTGIWSAIAPLLALFIGGVVAGRLAGSFARGYGALHGLVMWGLVTVGGAYMVTLLVSSAVVGAAAVGKTVVTGSGSALKNVAGGVMGGAENLGLDWNDALGPINQRLRVEGKPAVSADEMQAATKDAISTSIREGQFNRNVFANALAQNSALSRADAQQLTQRIETQFGDLKTRVTERAKGVAATVGTGALKAVDTTGKALWGVFGALLLGLIAAIFGGALGVPRVYARERVARGPITTTIEPPPRGPILPPREAYPRG
jgi:hypothetical protein